MLNNRNLININKTRMHKGGAVRTHALCVMGRTGDVTKWGKELSVNYRNATAKRSLIETIFRV